MAHTFPVKSMVLNIREIARGVPYLRKIVLKQRYRQYLQKLSQQRPIGAGPKILVVNHHFDQDIEAIAKGCGDRYSLFVVDCIPFFNQALLYFKTNQERDGIIPYSDLPRWITQGYREVARELFKDLYAIFAFEAIVMPSDSFWWIREFLDVIKEKGIPRIVLDKEGIITPYYYEMHSQQIRERYPFMSDHLLVWSERQKNYWIKAGAPSGCIQILGQPRSDFFFKRERWLTRKALGLDEGRRVILFFTFDVDAYIHIWSPEEIRRESLSWLPLRNDINNVLIEFATRHKDIDIVVKVHPQQSDISHIRKIFFDAGLQNIKTIEGADVSNHLIVNADLVVGFQTTALIEAMLTDKPVVYTGWSLTEQKLRDALIPFHSCRGLAIADSKECLVDILSAWAAGGSVGGDLAHRKELTDYYLNADGNVCDRLAGTFANILNRTK